MFIALGKILAQSLCYGFCRLEINRQNAPKLRGGFRQLQGSFYLSFRPNAFLQLKPLTVTITGSVASRMNIFQGLCIFSEVLRILYRVDIMFVVSRRYMRHRYMYVRIRARQLSILNHHVASGPCSSTFSLVRSPISFGLRSSYQQCHFHQNQCYQFTKTKLSSLVAAECFVSAGKLPRHWKPNVMSLTNASLRLLHPDIPL